MSTNPDTYGAPGRWRDLLRLARPYQWVKNGFVFAGVIFGHAWDDPDTLERVLRLFAAFCLVSSAVYAANDVADREADRTHPVKRGRPVASGRVSVAAAVGLAVLLGASGLLLAATVSPLALAFAAAYCVVNAAYSAGLKHVGVLDVFLIAAGFMLRLLAGTTGLDIEPSRWLLLCGLMVTLFLGFAKRRAEIGEAPAGPAPGADATSAISGENASGASAGDVAGGTAGQAIARPALEHYTPALLDLLIGVSAAGLLVCYGLYTIDPATVALHGTGHLIATLPPVAYGLFRYLRVLYRRGGGADPSLEFLRDPHLIGAAVVWLALSVWLIA